MTLCTAEASQQQATATDSDYSYGDITYSGGSQYDQDVAENNNSFMVLNSSDSNSINIKEEPGGDLSEHKKSGDCEAQQNME